MSRSTGEVPLRARRRIRAQAQGPAARSAAGDGGGSDPPRRGDMSMGGMQSGTRSAGAQAHGADHVDVNLRRRRSLLVMRAQVAVRLGNVFPGIAWFGDRRPSVRRGVGPPLPPRRKLTSSHRRGGCSVSQTSSLLTTKEAAAYLRLSHRTLERYRVTGEGPRYLKMGRLVFYRREDLDHWLETRSRRSTSDPGPQETDRCSQSTPRRPTKNRRPTVRRRATTTDQQATETPEQRR